MLQKDDFNFDSFLTQLNDSEASIECTPAEFDAMFRKMGIDPSGH